MMNFELLPNEIFLDLFDYFNGMDLLHTFYNLNFRFNFLLYKQFRKYKFDFNCISKRNFDLICQHHLSFIADRIITLCLCNSEDTPEQINVFLSYIPSFKQFIGLRALSIGYIHSYEILLKILDECHYLCNLTSLQLYYWTFPIDENNLQIIIDKIWSLPKLNYCNFGITSNESSVLFTPTKISLTLENVVVYGIYFNFNEINQLFKCTPCLKHLSISIASVFQDNFILSSLLTLTHLNIQISNKSEDRLIKIFQNTPNLYRLEINLFEDLINGHQWEQIIRKYLTNLKVFQLTMYDMISISTYVQEEADNLFDSFRSSFWIDEHRWFIRCWTSDSLIQLCTSRNTATDYNAESIPDFYKSTYPNDNIEEFCNQMISIYDENFFDTTIPSSICLSHIEFLYMKLPINEQFWSIVPTLKQLRWLSIKFHNDTLQSQVQVLLDQASHLETLIISQDDSLPLQTALFRYTNSTVRELHLHECNYYFNEEECITLAHSPLGLQCQVLSIVVKNCESIIILVQQMNKLRILKVVVNDENNDKHIQWLKDYLPSTYIITRNVNMRNGILVWI
ncbi:unnamed protein product [Adineta steineri]|uniref:F-box domain-containing protein n=1 Tax=Adineta steineri TaxID=433720 RepID=A0A814KID7_9BILA|nr:unnamed protein product [Adineta steineri]CAF3560247.1 unnamed protein product [Adineta steineri]